MATAATLLLVERSPAVVIFDGSIVGDGYGAPVAVQTVNTQFGDDTSTGDVFTTNKGSELNAAYAKVEGGTLHLALTGNLEDNFNKLVLFFDSVPGGQNVLGDEFSGENPVVDPSPFPSDPGMLSLGRLAGSSFDPGFEADYALVLRHGFNGSINTFDVDFAILGATGVSSQYLGTFNPTFTLDWSGSGTTGTGAANAAPINVALNNSNVTGIVAGDDAANALDAAAVATGVELGIPLSNLGNPTGPIRVTTLISSSNYGFMSNQFLGGLPAPFGNLGVGSNGAQFSLGDYTGDQFFTIAAVPEASAAWLVAVASAGAVTTKAVVWLRARRREAALRSD